MKKPYRGKEREEIALKKSTQNIIAQNKIKRYRKYIKRASLPAFLIGAIPTFIYEIFIIHQYYGFVFLIGDCIMNGAWTMIIAIAAIAIMLKRKIKGLYVKKYIVLMPYNGLTDSTNNRFQKKTLYDPMDPSYGSLNPASPSYVGRDDYNRYH